MIWFMLVVMGILLIAFTTLTVLYRRDLKRHSQQEGKEIGDSQFNEGVTVEETEDDFAQQRGDEPERDGNKLLVSDAKSPNKVRGALIPIYKFRRPVCRVHFSKGSKKEKGEQSTTKKIPSRLAIVKSVVIRTAGNEHMIISLEEYKKIAFLLDRNGGAKSKQKNTVRQREYFVPSEKYSRIEELLERKEIALKTE